MTKTKLSRYPGVAPFQTEQQDLYFGRENEIERLYNLLMQEDQVLLYARSGLGKSSLINAGLIPKLQKEHPDTFHILPIRFGAWQSEEFPSPVERIREKLPEKKGESLPDKIIPDENSLWYQFKSLSLQPENKEKIFLLVIDQFEELFTYPEEELFQYKRQMADLLYSVVPKTFRKVLEKKQKQNPDLLSPEEIKLLNQPQKIKVLMAIREDRYSQMNQLRDYLPDAMHHRFALEPLGLKQSRQAIVQPAQKEGDFTSPAFVYAEAALEKILDFLSKEKTQPVETTQLQILCSRIEDLGLREVKAGDIPDFENIFLEYYENAIGRIGKAEEETPARRFVETVLVQEGRRIAVDEVIARNYVEENTLNTLLSEHLLRAEPNKQGGNSYELAHDTLIAPVEQAREDRERDEAQERESKAREEEERRLKEQAEADRLARQKTQQELRRTRFLLGGALLALILAIGASIWAYRAQQAAQGAQEDTKKALKDVQIERDNAQKALADFEAAEKARKKAEIEQWLNAARTYELNGEPELKRYALQKALEIDSTREDIRRLLY